MLVTMERLPGGRVQLEITAEEAESTAAMRRAVRVIRNQNRLPGFSRGTAPLAMIERVYGPAVFREEANRYLMTDLYRRALEQTDITPSGDPEDIDIASIEPFRFTVVIPISADGQNADHVSIPEDEAYWQEYLGEYLDENDVRQLLDIDSPQRLSELVASHEILAVPTTRGMAFPQFQFLGGEVNPTISRVVKIFSDVVSTPYTTASWLRGVRFDEKSVAEWIASGENPEIVIQAAEDSAARLAA